ncbi:MAG: DUF4269 domain-containing protein [Bacteroidia bacterium]
MVDFKSIDYLKDGNSRQKRAFEVLEKSRTMEKLKKYSPILTGTIPIGIDIPTSDLDIICYWENKFDFIEQLKLLFSNERNFVISELQIDHQDSIIAKFILEGMEFEVFGQNIPTALQNAYRHLLIEHQILMDKGDLFNQQIIKLKLQGYKTEPAFAKLLNLEGNAYKELLNYKNDF